MIGHNGGPPIATGSSWARHCWTQARADLLPTLPLEIIRLRVARARAIGLEYKTYATIRATTGRDIVAFLYSSEALQIRPLTMTIPVERAEKLREQQADRLLFAATDIRPEVISQSFAQKGITLAAVCPAPAALGTWAAARAAVRAALDPLKLPGDAVVLIGEGRLQQDWAEAGTMAAFLSGGRFFTAA